MSNPLDDITLNIDDGEVVSDVIVITVTQRMDTMGQNLYVTTTPNTGFVTVRGALEEALDYVNLSEYVDQNGDE